MCELNVIEQMLNVCKTNSVRESWLKGQSLSVHGWIYGLRDGLLRNLSDCFSSQDEMAPHYLAAVEGIKKRVLASVEKHNSGES